MAIAMRLQILPGRASFWIYCQHSVRTISSVARCLMARRYRSRVYSRGGTSTISFTAPTTAMDYSRSSVISRPAKTGGLPSRYYRPDCAALLEQLLRDPRTPHGVCGNGGAPHAVPAPLKLALALLRPAPALLWSGFQGSPVSIYVRDWHTSS